MFLLRFIWFWLRVVLLLGAIATIVQAIRFRGDLVNAYQDSEKLAHEWIWKKLDAYLASDSSASADESESEEPVSVAQEESWCSDPSVRALLDQYAESMKLVSQNAKTLLQTNEEIRNDQKAIAEARAELAQNGLGDDDRIREWEKNLPKLEQKANRLYAALQKRLVSEKTKTLLSPKRFPDTIDAEIQSQDAFFRMVGEEVNSVAAPRDWHNGLPPRVEESLIAAGSDGILLVDLFYSFSGALRQSRESEETWKTFLASIKVPDPGFPKDYASAKDAAERLFNRLLRRMATYSSHQTTMLAAAGHHNYVVGAEKRESVLDDLLKTRSARDIAIRKTAQLRKNPKYGTKGYSSVFEKFEERMKAALQCLQDDRLREARREYSAISKELPEALESLREGLARAEELRRKTTAESAKLEKQYAGSAYLELMNEYHGLLERAQVEIELSNPGKAEELYNEASSMRSRFQEKETEIAEAERKRNERISKIGDLKERMYRSRKREEWETLRSVSLELAELSPEDEVAARENVLLAESHIPSSLTVLARLNGTIVKADVNLVGNEDTFRSGRTLPVERGSVYALEAAYRKGSSVWRGSCVVSCEWFGERTEVIELYESYR